MAAMPNPQQPAAVGPAIEEAEDPISDEIEVSPSGRWKRMRQPYAFNKNEMDTESNLSYDNEKGITAVWNQMLLSKRRWDMWNKQQGEANPKSRMNELKAKVVKEFKSLLEIKHVNIVLLLDFWTDGNWEVRPGDEKGRSGVGPPRIVWIAEQMTAGTLKRHIKKVKGNGVKIGHKIWKRWCHQILSALRYLHKSGLPHGNIKSSTIHVQHTGAIKIGSRNMRILNENVKTMKVVEAGDWVYVAPEAIMASAEEETGEEDCKEIAVAPPNDSEDEPVTARERQIVLECKADIYAFGIVALEMISLSTPYSEYPKFQQLMQAKNENTMPESLDALENDALRDSFIRACLKPCRKRPSAEKLMLREVLHTVPPLQHFAAHRLVSYLKEVEVTVRTNRQGTSTKEEFDTHDWLTTHLIEPYRNWTEGSPWSVSRNMWRGEPPATEGDRLPLTFPENLVDIETLIDEVTKGLHEMYSVIVPQKSVTPAPQTLAPGGVTPPGGESDLKNGQVDVAPDNTATSGVVAVVGDDEKEPVVKTITPRTPEDKRINTDQIQVVVIPSQDDGMLYDVSVTLHLQDDTSTTSKKSIKPNTVTRRLVQFGYPNDLEDSQNIVEQLILCGLLHDDDAELVKLQIDKALAEHTQNLDK